MITVSASQSFTAGRLAVALSYGIGSAVVLYLLMLGGRRLAAPLARRGPGLQIAMGAVMVVVALAMLGELRHQFQNRIASDLPSFLVNPIEGARGHRRGPRRAGRRPRRRGPRGRRPGGRAKRTAAPPRSARPGDDSGLPVLGQAPEFVGNQRWFNTPGGRPLTLRGPARPGRPGRLLDLQLHQLPAHPALPEGLGPALPQGRPDDRRRPLARVPLREGRRQRRRSDRAQRHPTTRSSRTTTWRPGAPRATSTGRPSTSSTPDGRVRFAHFGEGEYGEKEQVIRELLAEAGHAPAPARSRASAAIAPSAGVTTPETYLGAARAERFTNPMLSPGTHDFGDPPAPRAERIRLPRPLADRARLGDRRGRRLARPRLRRPPRLPGARLAAAAAAPHAGAARRPPDPRRAGRRRRPRRRRSTVAAQRLYDLVDLPAGRATTCSTLEPGSGGRRGYAFTFG